MRERKEVEAKGTHALEGIVAGILELGEVRVVDFDLVAVDVLGCGGDDEGGEGRAWRALLGLGGLCGCDRLVGGLAVDDFSAACHGAAWVFWVFVRRRGGEEREGRGRGEGGEKGGGATWTVSVLFAFRTGSVRRAVLCAPVPSPPPRPRPRHPSSP